MEKLIELLNEYDGGMWYQENWKIKIAWADNYNNRIYINLYIISKKFWFIKWLVENDKIKDNGIKPRTDLVKEIQIVDYETGKSLWWKNQYSETEQLIMCLSIQDNPLEYLCSILK